MRTYAIAQDVALRLEPDASPDDGTSATDTVPPAPMAAVLLANSARWQLRHGATSMAVALRGLSLLIAQAEGTCHLVLQAVRMGELVSRCHVDTGAGAMLIPPKCCTGITEGTLETSAGVEAMRHATQRSVAH